MLGLEYREELRKNAELLQEVKDTFDIDNAYSAYTLEIALPVIKVLLYATSHEVRHIKKLMEELDCDLEEDDSSSFYTERLEPSNLFKCLRLLAPDCLWAVLERLKSHHTGAIEELKKTILSNDFDGFVSALNKNEINTEPITPISNYLFFQIRLDGLRNGFLELYEMTNKTEKEQSLQEIKDKALRLGSDCFGFLQDWSSSQHFDKIGAVYCESFERVMLSDDFEQRLYNDDQLFSQEENERNFAKSIKKVYPNFVEGGFKSDEFIITRYKEFLSGYCQDSSNLSTYAKIEIERLLKSKYFESIWSRFDEFDNNTAKVLKKEIDEYYKKHGLLEKDAIEAEEQNKETPQMGEEQTSKSPAEVEEQKNAEKGTTQNKDEKLYADKWPLPDDFFEPAYIDDDCPQEDYFPDFLKDLIQFEGQNKQLDGQNVELKKKDLETLSRKFSEFIDDLASKNYIINDVDNKLALARALTGRRVKSSVKRVNWSKPKALDTPNGNINAICFLIKWLYPLHISNVPRKYEHILTVFEGLEGKKPSSGTGDNIKKSPIKDSVEKFLLGLVECTQIVNGEKLKLRIKKFGSNMARTDLVLLY